MEKIVTFGDFVASRRSENDLSDLTNSNEVEAGFVYLDSYYIVAQTEADPVESAITNTHYVVTIGNGEFTFGENLADAERFLWDNFVATEMNWKLVRFGQEFGSGYELDPGQVWKLIELGFKDSSWHNNRAPSFDLLIASDASEREFYVRIWFDAPNEADRWDGGDQFVVSTYIDSELIEELISTDRFEVAVVHALGAAALPVGSGEEDDVEEWGSERQIGAENAFSCYVVDEALSEDRAGLFEAYAMKATTSERVAYGRKLILEQAAVANEAEVKQPDIRRTLRGENEGTTPRLFAVRLKVQIGEYEKSALHVVSANDAGAAGRRALEAECHGNPRMDEAGNGCWDCDEMYYRVYSVREIDESVAEILRTYL